MMNVSDLLANLTPSIDATIKVVNESGVENTGILRLGDKVEVTSGDKLVKVVYTLNIFDSVLKTGAGFIRVYPNRKLQV